jgi:hypothetical protein
MYDTDLTPAALAAIDKVEKLLRLAKDGRGNENEAQSALDMAHRILEAHNLDMALVERKAGDSAAPHAKREDKTTGGGLYKWQRAVWEETAKLNMCRYFAIRGLARGSKYENRVVGKPENVLMTRLMAEYLQETIERLAAEWAKDNGYSSRFVQPAIIFREGMADTISSRLRALHRERVQEAERKAREQKATQNHPGAATTGTALTIVDVMGSEEDLNNDHLRGWELGRTARERRESEARLNEANRRRDLWQNNRAAYMAEFQDDTVDQAAQQNSDRYDADYELYLQGKDTPTYGKGYKASKSRGGGYSYRETAEDRRRAQPSFYEGQDAGRSVGLDKQIDEQRSKRIG